MKKLTEERLLEIGFSRRTYMDNIYFYNSGFCLFLSTAAVWMVGWDLGVPVTGHFDSGFIPYITSEEELREYVSKLDPKVPLKD